MASSPVLSLNDTPSAYEYDDVEFNEDLEFWHSSDNINDIISPNNEWLDNVTDLDNDLFYAELQAAASRLGQVYKHFSKPWYELLGYNAGFFWLRLPEPSLGK